jgi:predicted CXXCH cytochrome family protein
MLEATEETVLGDFDAARFRGNGIDIEFSRDAGGGFRIETENADGEREEFPVAYTFGVDPLQQYLIPLPGGRYQALNVAWDSRPADEGGQRWFHLYPDENIPPGDRLHWTGGDMNWNYQCAECHSTDLRKNYDLATGTFATTWEEVNVGCEACHGPASNHVNWAEAERRGEAGPAPAAGGFDVDLGLDDPEWNIDPTTGLATRVPALDYNSQPETCGRCHARRSTQWDYEHGQDLTQTHRVALIDEGLYYPDGQIRDEVYVYGSFLQSRMHAKGVACSDCHEPHTSRVLVDGNGLCNRCHAAGVFDTFEHVRHEVGTPGAACVDCHMPETTYMVIDDRGDHSFRVPRPDLSEELGSPNACSACHTDQSNAWAAAAVEEWFPGSDRRGPHYGQAIAAAWRGEGGAGRALREVADDWEQPPMARASAVSLLGRYPDADALASIDRGLSNSNSLIRSAAVTALEAYDPGTRMRMAYPLLRDRDRSVRLQAARVLASVPLAELGTIERDTIVAAVDELIAALQTNAERSEFQLNIGVLYAETGRFEAAEAAYEAAIRLEPGAVAGRVNLADLYRGLGRDAEGEILLREAVEQQPDNADVHYALGLLLVRRGQHAAAAESLERAWRLAVDNSRYGVAYALVLDSQGDLAGATEVLRQVERRHPRDPSVLSAMVQGFRKAGDLSTALEYARRLADLMPADRGVRALVEELEAEERR